MAEGILFCSEILQWFNVLLEEAGEPTLKTCVCWAERRRNETPHSDALTIDNHVRVSGSKIQV